MGLIETLLCLKAIVVTFAISLGRKIVRRFSGRAETWFAEAQYDALNTILTYYGVEDIGFQTAMNMGFDHPDYDNKAMDELFEGIHPITRLQLQLYHRVATAGDLKIDLKGKKALEVGCGRGGGTAFIASKCGLSSMTGIDLSADGIKHCQEKYQKGNLDFKVGNAQEMPLESNTYDVLLNVESSHCYPKVGMFLKESVRVLKPGGHFLYCDISTPAAVAQLKQFFPALGLEIIAEEDVTKPMINALNKAASFREGALKKFPSFLRPAVMNVIGQPGSITHTNFEEGTWCYVRFACRKK